MAQVTLTFTAPLNVSCQVGDTAYYVNTTSEGGFNVNNSNIVEIGSIRQITNPTSNSPTIICESPLDGQIDGEERFILFSKDNKANLSSILGYYASVKLVNTSKKKAELFSVNSTFFISSK